MKLQFLGAAGTVTGSCFLLDAADTRIMIDCGMFQGLKEVRERNYGNFLVPPRSVNYLLLTHAHIDHSGMIPKLVKNGFKGKVFTTAPTLELCEALLPDSAHIQEMEVERKNRKSRRAGRPMIDPIYTVDEAYNSLSLFKPVMYNEIVQITPDIRARFVDAGHILGSAMVEVCVREGGQEVKLVFSGDIGNKDRPFLKDPSTIAETDFLIMESTYGARLHEQGEKEIELLYGAIWETYKKGGNLVIPAFAVERTQDLLYHLYLLVEAKRMPPMTIYIDSPLAQAATEIFRKHREVYDQEATNAVNKGLDPLNMPGLRFTRSAEESMALNGVNRSVIISASGMCEAGRIRHHLKHNLWRQDSTVLFVGYQAAGTMGRQLLEGAKSVRILGDEIAVKADIKFIEGYSAHADQAGLVDWVKKFTRPPREIFLVHGEPESLNTLAGLLKAELGMRVTVPGWQESAELLSADPATETRRPVDSALASLAAKVQSASVAGLGQIQREEILRRLAELEGFIEQETKKGS